MERKFYAIADSFTGLFPTDYSAGFANSKFIAVFGDKKARDFYVSETKMTAAKAVSLKEAKKTGFDFLVVVLDKYQGVYPISQKEIEFFGYWTTKLQYAKIEDMKSAFIALM